MDRLAASNRTEANEDRLAELETRLSPWLDLEGRSAIPAAAGRSCIETAARKLMKRRA